MPRQPSLDILRNSLHRLSLEEKQEIWTWLGQEIHAEPSRNLEVQHPSNRAISEERHYECKTYQQEKRRCGKAGCRCVVGEVAEVGHGPYWYAYWKKRGKVRSQYVGKKAPWQE